MEAFLKRFVLSVICAIILSASNSMAGGPYKSLEDASREKARLDKEEHDEGVILWSADNIYFVVKRKEAKKSETLNSLMEDSGIEHPLPLPNVKGEALRYIVAWLESEEQFKGLLKDHPIKNSIFRDLVLAANYMDIKDALPKFLTLYGNHLQKILSQVTSKPQYDVYKADLIDKLPKDLRKLLVQQLFGLWTPLVGVLSIPEYSTFGPRFSPDSKTIVTYSRDNYSGRQVRADLWSVDINKNPKPLKTAELRETDLHQISPNGNWVSSKGLQEMSESVKDLLSGFPHRFEVFPRLSWNGAWGVFSPGDTKFLSCTSDPDSPPKAVWSLNPPLQYPKSRYPLSDSWCSSTKFIGEEEWLLERWQPPGGIRLWDAHPEAKGLIARPSAIFEQGQEIKGWEVSPDGKLLATITPHGTRLWKIEANDNPQPLATLPLRILAFSPDGKRIAALSGTSGPGTLELFDFSTPLAPRKIASFGEFIRDDLYPGFCRFAADGSYIAFGSNQTFALFQATEGWRGYKANLGSLYATNIVFSPDNQWIAIGARNARHASNVLLFARPSSQIDLASALILNLARSKAEQPRKEGNRVVSDYLPPSLIRSRLDLPDFLRQALTDDPYADVLLYGPQREPAEPELKKPKPATP